MTPSQAPSQAVTFDHDMNEPLLERDPSEKTMEDTLVRRLKRVSLLLGIFIGYFIQFSTLGANFLLLATWSEQESLEKSKHELVAISIGWSMFTSAVAFLILGFLRQLVTVTYQTIRRDADDVLKEIILHLECRFVVGSVVGVCTAWTVTDMFLGMPVQIFYSIVTLVSALCWCRVTIWWFASAERRSPTPSEAFLV